MYKSDIITVLRTVRRDLADGSIPTADRRLTDLLERLESTTHMRALIFCANCGQDARHMAHGLCCACYQYQWRTGRPRPNFNRVRYCRGCRKNVKHHGRGYCNRCYMRRLRRGELGKSA